MSYGYARKQSSASRDAQRRRAAGERVRRLYKLRVDEVSSVTAGAGIGCRVLIRKNHQESKMSLQDTIAKSFSLRAEGKLSDFDLGVMHQKRAAERGETLDEYYKSAEGQLALQAATRSHYFQMQVETSLGNGHGPLNEALKRGADVPSVPRRPGPATGGQDADWNERAGHASRDQTGDDPDDESNESSRPVHTSASDTPRDSARRKPRYRKALTDVELTKLYRASGG